MLIRAPVVLNIVRSLERIGLIQLDSQVVRPIASECMRAALDGIASDRIRSDPIESDRVEPLDQRRGAMRPSAGPSVYLPACLPASQCVCAFVWASTGALNGRDGDGDVDAMQLIESTGGAVVVARAANLHSGTAAADSAAVSASSFDR